MLKKHSQLFQGIFVALDLVVVTFSWLISYWIRFSLGVLPIDKGIPPFRDYVPMLIFVWLIWWFFYKNAGLYKASRGRGIIREVFNLVRANTFSVILLLAATYLFKEKSVPLSRLVFLIFWALQIFLSITSRVIVRSILRKLRRKGFNLRYALIVGNGPLAHNIALSMIANKEYGIELLGFLANDEEQTGPKIAPILGTYKDLPELLDKGGIDQVIVALPLSDHDQLEAVVSSIGDTIVDIKLVPDIHKFIQLGSEIEEFDGIPVVSLASTPLDGMNRILKRLIDLFVGSFLFIIFLPVMILLGILVKLTSKGPIFFTQERVGLDGKTFKIIKFRTMLIDAEKNGAKFATRGDSRTTFLGAFFRRWSLDELPQLVNVIFGNMSLVGPRPERPVFIGEFRKRVPKYMLRHKVQAGMTGWAQINGWRGNTSIEKRIEHDLFYIENWSISLDLKILGLTLIKGFRNRNAY